MMIFSRECFLFFLVLLHESAPIFAASVLALIVDPSLGRRCYDRSFPPQAREDVPKQPISKSLCGLRFTSYSNRKTKFGFFVCNTFCFRLLFFFPPLTFWPLSVFFDGLRHETFATTPFPPT